MSRTVTPMIDLALVPLRSVGPFLLEAAPDAISVAAATLGMAPRRARGLDDLADNAIQIEYDVSGRALFIGVSAAPAIFRLTFAGVDLFDRSAAEVRALFAGRETNLSDRAGEDHLGTLIFPEQIVALWSADTQYDRIRLASGERPLRRVWAQIGIGSPAYLAVIRGIR